MKAADVVEEATAPVANIESEPVADADIEILEKPERSDIEKKLE